MYGHYYLVFPWYYTRWMLYYLSNPVMDVPNVLYVYWKHAVTFKASTVKKMNNDDSDDESSKASVNEKFVPYEINRDVKVDFHLLQVSEQIFVDEYERVRELVNTSSPPAQRSHISEDFETYEHSFSNQAGDDRLI